MSLSKLFFEKFPFQIVVHGNIKEPNIFEPEILQVFNCYSLIFAAERHDNRNIFSYVATVIVIPIVIEGILGLRERIKGQTKTEERKDKLEDVLKEVVQLEAEKEAKREGDSNG